MSEENEIKVGDLITCFDCHVGVVYHIKIDRSVRHRVICFISQETGGEDWHYENNVKKIVSPKQLTRGKA